MLRLCTGMYLRTDRRHLFGYVSRSLREEFIQPRYCHSVERPGKETTLQSTTVSDQPEQSQSLTRGDRVADSVAINTGSSSSVEPHTQAEETALEVARQRRQAILDAGGYCYVLVKADRFTDVTKHRKQRERTPRPWVGAFKPVILRKNTIMPAKETVVTPMPKIVLSPQWPITYRQKMMIEAELEFVPGKAWRE